MTNKMLFLSFLLLPIVAHADQIDCYSGGSKIFSTHYAMNVHINEYDRVVFYDAKRKKVVLATGECIIKIK